MTVAIDLTTLSGFANVDFGTFKAFHQTGQSLAGQYYNVLAAQGQAEGLANVTNYALLAKNVAGNSGFQGFFANSFSSEVAEDTGDNGVDFTVGSDNWLQMQYTLMQADFALRQQKVNDGGTGELNFNDTIIIHTTAFQSIGLPCLPRHS